MCGINAHVRWCYTSFDVWDIPHLLGDVTIAEHSVLRTLVRLFFCVVNKRFAYQETKLIQFKLRILVFDLHCFRLVPLVGSLFQQEFVFSWPCVNRMTCWYKINRIVLWMNMPITRMSLFEVLLPVSSTCSGISSSRQLSFLSVVRKGKSASSSAAWVFHYHDWRSQIRIQIYVDSIAKAFFFCLIVWGCIFMNRGLFE